MGTEAWDVSQTYLVHSYPFFRITDTLVLRSCGDRMMTSLDSFLNEAVI